MPEGLLRKLLSARRFNQGFATVEYTASALVDLGLHLDPSPGDVDVLAFERQELARIGMPDAIAMRHRTPHFQHIFRAAIRLPIMAICGRKFSMPTALRHLKRARTYLIS